jgi:glycosyltransferase involved in cell wall biosynthesis
LDSIPQRNDLHIIVNIGLAHTDSEKVIFADADDYFNYCLSDILDEYKEDETDIVFFNRLNVDSFYYTYSSKRDWYGKPFKKMMKIRKKEKKCFDMKMMVLYVK